MAPTMRLRKPHAVCIPYPTQGHIDPMMKLAKILHFHDFHITFVDTEYNHDRLLRSRGPRSLDGIPSFRFAAIPDGLSDGNDRHDTAALCASIHRHCLQPFIQLVKGLDRVADEGNGPHVTCIVGDGCLPFVLEAKEELGIKVVLLWTASACGLLGYAQYPRLVQEGYTPVKDTSCLTKQYLETPIDWIPCMKGASLKDMPSFIRTPNPKDIMLNFFLHAIHQSRKASAIILNTFDAMERDTLAALSPNFPPLYPVGPLNLILNRHHDTQTASIGSSLWKQDHHCIQWLESRQPNSVLYVNFGSNTTVTNDQMMEFAWGLANSGKSFLWIIRPDMVRDEQVTFPLEFLKATKDRSLLVSWCDQERVMSHPSIGGFLTHSGWNSTLDTVCNGVPIVSWPFFAEQQTNCWFSCNAWGIGMEIDSDVKREVVEKQVRELMDGEKGKEMKMKAMEWKRLAEEATRTETGASYLNLKSLIHKVLLP